MCFIVAYRGVAARGRDFDVDAAEGEAIASDDEAGIFAPADSDVDVADGDPPTLGLCAEALAAALEDLLMPASELAHVLAQRSAA